ncbi:exonuclease 1 isoform X2, partial [Tanacetum coccineum]
HCTEFKYDNLSQYSELSKGKKKGGSLDLSMFSHEMIIKVCVFAGFDYLKSLKRIKLRKAYQLAKDFDDHNMPIEAEKGNGTIFRRVILKGLNELS